MPNTARRWTRDEVLALPDDGNRYELVDGELLVSPSPVAVHQFAVWELLQRIGPYVQDHSLGEICFAPADLDLRSGQLVQPDLFVVDPLPVGRRPEWADFGIPRLVVEVLSPSTAFADRHRKRLCYQQSGVAEYWIVDLDARLIERWTPADARPEIATERIEWHPRPELPPLVLELPQFVRRVLRER